MAHRRTLPPLVLTERSLLEVLGLEQPRLVDVRDGGQPPADGRIVLLSRAIGRYLYARGIYRRYKHTVLMGARYL